MYALEALYRGITLSWGVLGNAKDGLFFRRVRN